MADLSINIPEDIKPKPFFEELVPQQFKAITSATPLVGLDGTVFSLHFDIEGPSGGSWGIVVTDGKNMEIKPGGYDKALITMKLKESDWRDAIMGKAGMNIGLGMAGPSMDAAQAKAQFDTLKDIKGTLFTEITKDDGSIFPVTIMFNKAKEPQTKIKMKMADYLEMQSGKLDGPNAFMQGRIIIEGDMMFAMQLGQIRF